MGKTTSNGHVKKPHDVLQQVPKEVRKALADILLDLYQNTTSNGHVTKPHGVLQQVSKEVRKALANILLDLYHKAVFNARVAKAYAVLKNVHNEVGETLADIWHDKYRNHAAGREDLLAELLTCSAEEKLAWDALLLIVQFHLDEDMPFPPKLKYWRLDVLAKIREEPQFGGRKSWDHFVEEFAMVVAVADLSEKEGIPPTRNRKRKGQPYPKCCYKGGSACDIVGVAAGRLYEVHHSFRTVEGFWAASASPTSPIYRKGPSQRPVMEHPLYMLRDRKRVKPRRTASGTSENNRDLPRWLDFLKQREGCQ